MAYDPNQTVQTAPNGKFTIVDSNGSKKEFDTRQEAQAALDQQSRPR